FATALIQSSSTTTSMVVAFVASGTISVQNAIPVIMGANIGTAVTSTLVSLGHVTRQREFERAFAAGTVHDMFNLMAVFILLPIELATGYLSKSASALAGILAGTAGMEFKSPLKLITKPISKAIVRGISSFDFSQVATGVMVVLLGTVLLIVSLIFLSKLLRTMVLSKLQRFFQVSMYSNGTVAILIGLVFTAIVQSSSVTTSLMIPMAAAGVMTLRHVFPVALGANVGTTVTALLASLATGRPKALTIALVHLLFNISGILLFYPLPFMRQIPMRIADGLAKRVAEKRIYAVLFILIVYFMIPGLAILIT
ncbi:MAG: sodium dependent phosphate transporter, partial [Proteobacteria bacterium]|nr:sodium dependent phosphate transporter [Pseudomonadota bacterium]